MNNISLKNKNLISQIYDLYYGGTLITRDPSYRGPLKGPNLPKDEVVEQEVYERVQYVNYQAKIINQYKAYILSDSSFEYPEDKIFHVDFRAFASSALEHMLVGGSCYVLIFQGLHVIRRDVLKFDDNMQIKEQKIQSVSGYNIEIKIVSEGYSIKLDKSQPTIISDILEYITEFKLNDIKKSIISDTAFMNLEVYQDMAMRAYLMQRASIQISTGPSIGQSEIKQGEHIAISQGEPEIKFSSPPHEIISIYSQEIDKKIMNMASVVGLQREFQEDLSIDTSGVALSYRTMDISTIIEEISRNLAFELNTVVSLYQQNVDSTFEVIINVNPKLIPQANEIKLEQLKYLLGITADKEIQKKIYEDILAIVFDHKSVRDLEEIKRLVTTESLIVERPELINI